MMMKKLFTRILNYDLRNPMDQSNNIAIILVKIMQMHKIMGRELLVAITKLDLGPWEHG